MNNEFDEIEQLYNDIKLSSKSSYIYNCYLEYCKRNGERSIGANKYFSQLILKTGLYKIEHKLDGNHILLNIE